jgi:cytochrome c553
MIVRISLTAFVMSASLAAATPTFSKDVASILYNRCAECHRAGEAAPMALTSYQEARPWAKAIKAAVVQRKMPPWLADQHFGTFANERRLSDKEIETLSAWADGGAPEGDPKATPATPHFETGWLMGKPDVTIDIGRNFEVPEKGTVAYQYFTVPTNFTEDKWIEAAEVRPDKRAVVHHIIAFIQEPDTSAGQRGIGNLLVGYAPGEQPMILNPGTAKLVKAGSKIMFQVHYTPNGKPATDRSYIGLRFARQAPKYRAITANAMNRGFVIPAGDPAYEVKSTWTANREVTLLGFMPHMHLRGKDFKYTIVYPDGKQDVSLNVPKYDFNWQLSYDIKNPPVLPEGTRIDCVAHFDNSPNNKYNPDPTKEVKWGDQTWEEMMIGWFTYRVPVEPSATIAAN